MNAVYDKLKSLATERVTSHGAFGEHESWDRLNPDKLIEVVAEEACAHLLEHKLAYSPDYQIGIEIAVGMIKGKFNLT